MTRLFLLMGIQKRTEAAALEADVAAPQPGARNAVAGLCNWASLSLLIVAATALGAAINAREGLYSPAALLWLDLCVATTFAALFYRPSSAPTAFQRRLPWVIFLAALMFQFVQLYRKYPGTLWNVKQTDVRFELSSLKDRERFIKDPQERAAARSRIAQIEESLRNRRFQLTVLLAAALAAASLSRRPGIYRVAWPILLGVHFAMGVWVIRAMPQPHIDVWVFQQESASALLHGQNPYAMTFTNIYGPGAYVYGPGLTQEGRVNFGFPYTPLSLLMTIPGYVLGGDVRYSHLAAITLAGALLAGARSSRLSRMAALLLLFSPRVFMIVGLAWTEPLVILLLCATVFCACRMPRAMPYVLGLFLASKQYTIFAIPLAALLLPGPRSLPRPFNWRGYGAMLLKAGAVAAAVSLPLVLWNIPAFLRSAVVLQMKQPMRPDALSYLAWFWWNFSKVIAEHLTFLAFVAVVPAIVVAWKRCPSGPAGFALGLAVAYLAFLALNKQAFCNYYFFVIGTLCCAIALLSPPESRVGPSDSSIS